MVEKLPPIREIVKKEEWQKVRQSLLGKWMKDPEWCCKQLRNYLGNIKRTSYTDLRIVMNYLTGSFFRTRKNHQCVIKLRAEISIEMRKRKAKGEWK